MGLVFQNDALLPWYSVYDNIRLALVMRGVPKENQPRRIHELIAMVGLEGFADQLPGTLSGGMRTARGPRPGVGLRSRRLFDG